MKESEPSIRENVLVETLRNCFVYIDLIDNTVDSTDKFPMITLFDRGQVIQLQSDMKIRNMFVGIGMAVITTMVEEGYREDLKQFESWGFKAA